MIVFLVLVAHSAADRNGGELSGFGVAGLCAPLFLVRGRLRQCHIWNKNWLVKSTNT